MVHGDAPGAKQALEGANGNRRAKPVLFAARAVVAELSGDAAAVAAAKEQLAKAYPMIAGTPLGNFGTAATP